MSQLNYTTETPSRERGQHLNIGDRYSIKTCINLGLSIRRIAATIDCSPATVLNELKRGTAKPKGNRGRKPAYSPERGQKAYEESRSKCHRRIKVNADNPFIVWLIHELRTDKWSLDACVGRARREGLFPSEFIVCTKTLYNAVWKGVLLTPFDLPEALKRSRKKKERPRKNKRLFGTSIEMRPVVASLRSEFGHWEIDTIVGRRAGKESVVLTLVEKLTDYYIAIKIPGKTSEAVLAAMEALREEYGDEFFATVFKTITADNGSEFEGLSSIEKYGVKVFFTHPYTSWERAQNERHNRIFRRYIPKGVSIDNYSVEEIKMFADAMNALPRKLLGYATPEELFDGFLDQIYSINKEKRNLISTASVQLDIAI